MYPFPSALLMMGGASGSPPHPYGLVGVGDVGVKQAGGSVTLTYPTGIQAGDILLMFVNVQHASGTPAFTTPTGWTFIAQKANSSPSATTIFAYWKRAAGSETGTFTTPSGGSVTTDWCGAFIAAWGGCVASGSPIDDVQTGTANSATITYPSVSLSAANEIKVDFGGGYSGGSPTLVAPTGFSTDTNWSGANRPQMAVFEKQFTSSGATGTETGALTGGSRWVAMSFGLIPV